MNPDVLSENILIQDDFIHEKTVAFWPETNMWYSATDWNDGGIMAETPG